MHIDETGLFLAKRELTALLTFASKDPSRMHMHAVLFRADGANVRAYSTNGHVAVEADGRNEGVTGRWLISVDLLKPTNKLLGAGDTAKLCFAGATLREISILDAVGLEICTVNWPRNPSQDVEPPPVEKMLSDEFGKSPLERVPSIGLCADYLVGLGPIAKAACNARVVCLSPGSPREPVHFACEGKGNGHGTNWRGLIMPMLGDEKEESEAA